MTLKFLFVPADAVGHVNAHIGVGQVLALKGHTVYFAVSNSWKGKLAPLGFIEKYYEDESKEISSLEQLTVMVEAMSPAMALPPLQKLEHFVPSIYAYAFANVKETNDNIETIIAEVQPDMILSDAVFFPALATSHVPWMLIMSMNPLGISSENVPPPFCGLPISGDRSTWKRYSDVFEKGLGPIFKDFSDWVLEKGGPKLTYDGRSVWSPTSPYGNIYMYPEELNYTMHRPDPPNYYHFDTLARVEAGNFEIPSKLTTGPGKLVYFSLGTIGCADLSLMRKLIGYLAKSSNQFIVSKGPLGDQLDLADNMWGANNLPQTNILPLIDLVITHGGNNTITEAFYFGKRVLVLPLFCDQLDNGQRIEETGLGLQFQPYQVTEQELLDGIDLLLKNDLLERQMKAISTRMQRSNSQARAAELLEKVASNNKYH